MIVCERAIAERNRLLEENKRLKQALTNAPPGLLQIKKCGNQYKWYHRIKKRDSIQQKYISRENEEMAAKLAKKTYCESKLQENELEIAALNAYIGRHERIYKHTDRQKKNPAFRQLLRLKDIDRELAAWKEERYEKNEQYTEHLNIRAVNGTMVRSKSEAYILSALEARGIAYRYECKLTLGRVALYPDFTIRRPGTGEMILWEHFGMMSDAAYAKNAQDKIRKYMQHGYYPMKNLITTFEEEGKPLDFSLVMDIVEWL